MSGILHITSGDSCGGSLARAGLDGEVFVWHDVLYDGPRNPGWPDEETIRARARFLEGETGGGLSRDLIEATLRRQYRRIETAADAERVVLWFDACLFDMAMLAHILACLRIKRIGNVELLCVDAFPGIERYAGLGQLSSAQMASVYNQRRGVTDEQFRFAERVDRAFALQDRAAFDELAAMADAPLPWVPAAVARWLEEIPDEKGLGRLERLALGAIRGGARTPAAIFAAAAAADTDPQFWGDTTLWEKINGLAARTPPLVEIAGPADRLPVWESQFKDLNLFTITVPGTRNGGER